MLPMISIQPNLNAEGRVIRGIVALSMGAGAFFVWPHSPVAAIALGVAGAFVGLEAVRGWCALRACGVKTRFRPSTHNHPLQ